MSGPVLPQATLPVPVLRTDNLARSLAWYRDVLGLHVRWQVPHVAAQLDLPEGSMQLWQMPEVARQHCQLVLEGGQCIFSCHARLARTARMWIGPTPRLKPWGSWEFAVTDPDGNELRFAQWAVRSQEDASGPLARRPRHGEGRAG